ncbi:MAG: late competence development ComFB family protein [Spirochaetaceae bacterium]|nr:late competence development ComFB family protein [Spirochaetaceae bacterium]
MEIHNTMEELVIDEVNAICDSLEAKKNEGICTCSQCRQDAVCYVLNRTDPHYVVSHRGAARVNQAAGQQSRADLTSLVYDGIKHVSHNQRPYFTHNKDSPEEKPSIDTPVFNIPTIIGRVFNGLNFSPITGITVELLQNGVLALMKDNNWQNPYVLIPNTGGTFTFWPRPVPAEKPEIRGSFEFTVKITTEDFAELSHIFTIPVISEQVGTNFSLSRTFKLPDLYLFPPGEEKDQLVINV